MTVEYSTEQGLSMIWTSRNIIIATEYKRHSNAPQKSSKSVVQQKLYIFTSCTTQYQLDIAHTLITKTNSRLQEKLLDNFEFRPKSKKTYQTYLFQSYIPLTLCFAFQKMLTTPNTCRYISVLNHAISESIIIDLIAN